MFPRCLVDSQKTGVSAYKTFSKLPVSTESRIPIPKAFTHKSTPQTSKLSKKEPETSPPKPLLASKPTSIVHCPSSSLPQHSTSSRPGKLVQSNKSKSAAKTDTANKRPKLLSVPSQGTSAVQDKKTALKTDIKQNLDDNVENNTSEAVVAPDQVGTGW